MPRQGRHIFSTIFIIFIGHCVARKFEDYESNENEDPLSIDPTDFTNTRLLEIVRDLQLQLKNTIDLLTKCNASNKKMRIGLNKSVVFRRNANARTDKINSLYEQCLNSKNVKTSNQSFRRNFYANNAIRPATNQRYSMFGRQLVGSEFGGWLDGNIISTVGQLFDQNIKDEANRERIEREKLREKELFEKYTSMLKDPIKLRKLKEESDKAPKIIKQIIRRYFPAVEEEW